MASNPFIGGVNPPDRIPGSTLSQSGALGGQFNSRRTEPLISVRGGEVARVTFGSGQLIDPFNVWTRVGAPTANGLLTGGGIREGYGPYTNNDYWQLGTGNDVLDFAGDYTVAIVHYMASTVSTQQMLFSNGHANADGFYLDSGANLIVSRSAALELVSGGAFVVGAVNVLCAGRAGGSIFAKTNLQTIATVLSASQVPATTTTAKIGCYFDGSSPWTYGYVMEFYASTASASDALFTSIATEVKTKLGITAW